MNRALLIAFLIAFAFPAAARGSKREGTCHFSWGGMSRTGPCRVEPRYCGQQIVVDWLSDDGTWTPAAGSAVCRK